MAGDMSVGRGRSQRATRGEAEEGTRCQGRTLGLKVTVSPFLVPMILARDGENLKTF